MKRNNRDQSAMIDLIKRYQISTLNDENVLDTLNERLSRCLDEIIDSLVDPTTGTQGMDGIDALLDFLTMQVLSDEGGNADKAALALNTILNLLSLKESFSAN